MHGRNPLNLEVFCYFFTGLCTKPYLSSHLLLWSQIKKIAGLVSRSVTGCDSRHESGVVIILYKEKGLLDAVSFVFPDAHPSYYLHH